MLVTAKTYCSEFCPLPTGRSNMQHVAQHVATMWPQNASRGFLTVLELFTGRAFGATFAGPLLGLRFDFDFGAIA